jgi:hypothetical protein
MKSGPVVLGLAVVVIVGGVGYGFVREQEPAVAEKVTTSEKASIVEVVESEPKNVVEVDDLAAKPEDFSGEVVLKGVVAGVNKETSVFGIIDAREFEECGVLTCPKNLVPVKFDGKIPAVKTIVNITGEILRNDKGLVFEAKAVDVIK